MSPRDRSWLRPAFSPHAAPPPRGGPDLDRSSLTARFGSRSVVLSAAEFAVMDLLASHPHVMLTREEVSEHAWGEPLATPDRVTSAVKRIRQRLRAAGVDPDQLATIHALGYRWDPRPESIPAQRTA